MYICV
jgi:hypothetical protein